MEISSGCLTRQPFYFVVMCPAVISQLKRCKMQKIRRITLGRISVASVLLVLAFSSVFVMYKIAGYYKYLDAYSGDVIRGDQIAARNDLANLKYFHDLNKKLKPFKLDWIADKYFFKDARYREVAYDSMRNRFEKVVEDLKDDNSYWGRLLRANARWRLAQGVFEQALKKDPKTSLEEQKKADELALSTKDDYAEAIKLSGGELLPPKWNYDLTTNPNARAAGLQPKPPKIIIKLGLGGGKKEKGQGKDKGQGPKGEGTKPLDIKGPPTEAKPNPGVNRPG